MQTNRNTHKKDLWLAALIVLTLSALILTPVLASGGNSISSPDTASNVGQYNSLVLDSNGYPVVSYWDFTNDDLKLLHCNDADCVGDDESISSPDTAGNVGQYNSLVLDSNGYPVVSYWDRTNNDLKVLHCNDSNCSGNDESTSSPDTVGAVGFYTSLVLDSSGYPVVSYFDNTNDNLKLLHCNDPDCAGGDESITAPDTLGNVGHFTSLTLDSSGNPVISYHDFTNKDLKLLHCNDPYCAGDDESISSPDTAGNTGYFTSLALDSTGNPVIGYIGVDSSLHDHLILMHCNDPNCTGSDESITEVVPLGDVGIENYISLALDGSGNPIIAYTGAIVTYIDIDGFPYPVSAEIELRVLHCNDPDCTGGDESITIPDSADVVGFYTSLALDSSGYPVVSYWDGANKGLKLLHCGDAYCTVDTNTPPIVEAGGPYLGAVNTAIQFDGNASSDPDGDTLSYAWDFGDGNSDTGAAPTHNYAATGIYDVCLTVNDGTVDSAQVCTIAVVYDPSTGFVSGSGWIDSPEGAYMADPSLTGKAAFGFVSKYKKGALAPTGTTAFTFDQAGFDFYSDTYEWLVVNGGGTNAQFKGSGTVNDGLDPNGELYKFMLWAGDGSPDTFHIRIWWEDTDGTEYVVYDNGFDQPIGAGNIVVHKK